MHRVGLTDGSELVCNRKVVVVGDVRVEHDELRPRSGVPIHGHEHPLERLVEVIEVAPPFESVLDARSFADCAIVDETELQVLGGKTLDEYVPIEWGLPPVVPVSPGIVPGHD